MVTIFGDGSRIDDDLVRELQSRGAETAIVTEPIGWPASVKFAIARVDTAAGEHALRDLAKHEMAAARVICTCQSPNSFQSARDIRAICLDCSNQNLVSLMWHPHVSTTFQDRRGDDRTGPEISSDDLAYLVAREYMTTRKSHLSEQSVVLDESGRAARE